MAWVHGQLLARVIFQQKTPIDIPWTLVSFTSCPISYAHPLVTLLVPPLLPCTNCAYRPLPSIPPCLSPPAHACLVSMWWKKEHTIMSWYKICWRIGKAESTRCRKKRCIVKQCVWLKHKRLIGVERMMMCCSFPDQWGCIRAWPVYSYFQ